MDVPHQAVYGGSSTECICQTVTADTIMYTEPDLPVVPLSPEGPLDLSLPHSIQREQRIHSLTENATISVEDRRDEGMKKNEEEEDEGKEENAEGRNISTEPGCRGTLEHEIPILGHEANTEISTHQNGCENRVQVGEQLRPNVIDRKKDEPNTDTKMQTREKSRECRICGNLFDDEDSLNIHMAIHMGKDSKVCGVCDKVLHNLYSLTRHMRIHTGERPYVCKECSQSFTRRSSLKIHMRTHTGERPYVCKECSQGFNQRSILTRHMRTHTGERPFVCNICEVRFSRRHVLNRHMKIHT